MEKIFVKFMYIMSLSILFWITVFSKTEFISSENRMTADFSLSSPDAFFTDRLPFRDTLMRVNRDASLKLGKNEFSGAFLGRNGYIFSNEDVSVEILEKNLCAVDAFAHSIDTYLCIIPSKTDTLLSSLPRFYESDRASLFEYASENNCYAPDVLPTIRLAGTMGKYIYYRGDHHLTSLGSYYVYKSLCDELGIKAYGAENFSVGVVKSDFSGSDARKMLMQTNDKISLFRYKGDSDFTVENCDSGIIYNGVYDYEKLNSGDPYGIFPIADCGRVKITRGDDREVLLVVCDSYGDSLVPFLARHYDLDIIDPRYYGGSVKKLILENEYAKALLCFGMDTIASKEILYKLSF